MGLMSLPPVTASERWGEEPVLFQDFRSMKRYLRLSQGHRPAEKRQQQLRCTDCLSRAKHSPRHLVHPLFHLLPTTAPRVWSSSPAGDLPRVTPMLKSRAGLQIQSDWRAYTFNHHCLLQRPAQRQGISSGFQ